MFHVEHGGEMEAQIYLRNNQIQCDSSGVEVKVSRQALDETLDRFEEMDAGIKEIYRIACVAPINKWAIDKCQQLMPELKEKS